MVLTEEESWGFLSGGCIEADVALHAQDVLATAEPRALVYGRGSPFIDMRLPCGGRLEILVERVSYDDPTLLRLAKLTNHRQPAFWVSNGRVRSCGPQPLGLRVGSGWAARVYLPVVRLLVAGSDPFALAIGRAGQELGWEVRLLAPHAREGPAPFGLECDRRPFNSAISRLADRWTAVAVATHDSEEDTAALVPALASDAFFIGALGSRRRLGERRDALKRADPDATGLGRLRSPLGLPIGARNPREVAVATVAQIIEAFSEVDSKVEHHSYDG